MYNQEFLNYKLAGACTFFSDTTLKMMGYNHHKNLYPYRNNAILVYSKSGELDGVLFGDLNGTKKMIHSEIIKELYTITTAEELYPELFI